MKTGGIAIMNGPYEQLFGVYSGRINRESDLGFVWKASAIRDVIDGRKLAGAA